MQIHRIRGRDLTDALQRARADLGDGAVVLSREALPGGGVAIAVAEAHGAAAGRVEQRAAAEEPGLADLRERLARHGASRAFAERIAAIVARSGAQGAYALDAAARVIGKVIPAQPAQRRDGRTRVLAFAGPCGAGKTTVVAKLARELSAGGRRVAIASLDGVGVGAFSALKKRELDQDRHELRVSALRSTAELDWTRGAAEGLEVLLLDTPGVSLRERGALAALGGELARICTPASTHARAEVHLVLPATASRATLELALGSFSSALRGGPAAAVLTRLDESPEPGAALERCARARIPVSFLCDGPDARARLLRARGDHFADLFLRGKVAA